MPGAYAWSRCVAEIFRVMKSKPRQESYFVDVVTVDILLPLRRTKPLVTRRSVGRWIAGYWTPLTRWNNSMSRRPFFFRAPFGVVVLLILGRLHSHKRELAARSDSK